MSKRSRSTDNSKRQQPVQQLRPQAARQGQSQARKAKVGDQGGDQAASNDRAASEKSR